MQKYCETADKKILIFDDFPEETFQNRSAESFHDTISKWLHYTQSKAIAKRYMKN